MHNAFGKPSEEQMQEVCCSPYHGHIPQDSIPHCLVMEETRSGIACSSGSSLESSGKHARKNIKYIDGVLSSFLC